MESKPSIFHKFLSARYVMTLFVTFTFCIIALRCFDLALKSATDPKVFTNVKDIIMFILGAFVAVVQSMVYLYFGRTDREQYSDNGNGNGDEAEKIHPIK